MNVIDVGIKIATARKAKGMTQKELAEILHITDKAVSGNCDIRCGFVG